MASIWIPGDWWGNRATIRPRSAERFQTIWSTLLWECVIWGEFPCRLLFESVKKSPELCKCYRFFEKPFANWQETLPFSDLLHFLFVKLASSPPRGQVSTWACAREVVESRSWKDGQSCFVSNLLQIYLFLSSQNSRVIHSCTMLLSQSMGMV